MAGYVRAHERAWPAHGVCQRLTAAWIIWQQQEEEKGSKEETHEEYVAVASLWPTNGRFEWSSLFMTLACNRRKTVQGTSSCTVSTSAMAAT